MYCISLPANVSVVQWIELLIPVQQIWVRIPSGTLINNKTLKAQGFSVFSFKGEMPYPKCNSQNIINQFQLLQIKET